MIKEIVMFPEFNIEDGSHEKRKCTPSQQQKFMQHLSIIQYWP